MTTTILRGSTLRCMLFAAITLLVAMLAVSFTAPRDAHAVRNPNTVLPSTTGWVYVRDTPVACTASYPSHCYSARATAWRWTGSQWQTTSLAGGTSVYAYPYTGAFHWVWTRSTGWLAIQTKDLDTGYSCTGYACPVF